VRDTHAIFPPPRGRVTRLSAGVLFLLWGALTFVLAGAAFVVWMGLI